MRAVRGTLEWDGVSGTNSDSPSYQGIIPPTQTCWRVVFEMDGSDRMWDVFMNALLSSLVPVLL